MNYRAETKVEVESRKIGLAQSIVAKYHNPAKGAHLQIEDGFLRVVINDTRSQACANQRLSALTAPSQTGL